jgi:hypothetical protein
VEATTSPDVDSIVGAYVKGFTTLDVAITGATGVYGSSVVSYKIEVAGQTLNAVSGTTGVLTQSGTLTLRGTVTDSRGRVKVKNISITVLNYAPPIISSASAARSDAGGTVDPEGTYIRVDLEAAVQSLVVGTQKNDLTWRIKTRERTDDTDWASITSADSGTAGSTGFDDAVVIGTYPTNTSYTVRIEVEDELGSVSAVEETVSTGGVQVILSHTSDSVGFGKYPEEYDEDKPTSIDAREQIYQNEGKAVLDVDSVATTTEAGIVELATDAETQTGTDTNRAVTPAGLASLTSTTSRAGLVELATSTETTAGTDTSRAITPAALAESLVATRTRGVVSTPDGAVASGGKTAKGSSVVFGSVGYATIVMLRARVTGYLSASPPSGRYMDCLFTATAGTLTHYDPATDPPTSTADQHSGKFAGSASSGTTTPIQQTATLEIPANTASTVQFYVGASNNGCSVAGGSWEWERVPV